MSVSPVSANTNERKSVPGTNLPFSGRLSGVAPLALASALASNGAVPSVAVSWIVTHLACSVSPECRRGIAAPNASSRAPAGSVAAGWNVIGAPSTTICSAWSLPARQVAGRCGMKR